MLDEKNDQDEQNPTWGDQGKSASQENRQCEEPSAQSPVDESSGQMPLRWIYGRQRLNVSFSDQNPITTSFLP
ncbi:MAG: hypothetical protein JNL84_02895 [Candidatus Accumulibacter sp.]|nr:hypothetical protein [Accumulibacter sp.]